MTKKLTIHGLPRALAMDGWWFDAPRPGGGDQSARPRAGRPRGARLLVLVGLADLLFWGHAPGFSVALFGLALFLAAVWPLRPAMVRPALLALAGALPVAEHLQPLSLAFLAAFVVMALLWARHPGGSAAALGRAGAGFVARLPLRWLACLDPRRFVPARSSELARPMMRNWAFPLGGSLVFAALLMDANPVLARVLDLDLDAAAALRRGLFWAGAAVFAAPFLAPAPPLDAAAPRTLRLTPPGINAGSVLRALVLFNLLIGLQSLSDLSILVFGAQLPQGITFAAYAHRGAYPLLATAILAGLFALAARPFLHEHRAIRPLLLLWLVQNMVLCAAAALRLDLYVDAFGLTYLRLHAVIWMALVAAGLGLALWQGLWGHGNGWLLRRVFALATAVLYLCCFVNFAQVIAARNVQRAAPDLAYLCALGPLAAGPVLHSGLGRIDRTGHIDLGPCQMRRPRVEGWREWGFRTWRAARYPDRVETGERPR